METRITQTLERPLNLPLVNRESDDESTEKRLAALFALNSQIAREKSLFRSERERTEHALMTNPWSVEKTFATFGLLLGVFPPLAMFIKFFSDKGIVRAEDLWMIGVVAIINLIAAIVGYFSGRLIGRIVFELEKLSWTEMILALPFFGIFWGILAGGAGGVIVFVFGAIFGAMLGAAVGAVALPAFTIFHRLLKRGDQIELKHFLPVGFGVVLVICAFILGL